MFRAKSQNSIHEEEGKFILERISGVEKHFTELSTIFAQFTRKAARLRDKNDEVSKVIQNYAETESINRSTSEGLANFAGTLSAIGDYRDSEIHRLEAKVVSPLLEYEYICKNVRKNVIETFTARNEQITKKRELYKSREKNPRDRQKISKAETDLMRATSEVTRLVKELEDQIDTFESRKLRDLKTVLLDFVKIELCVHTKTIELLTKAYHDVAEIDETKDLGDFQIARGDMDGEFREVMHAPDSVARLETVRRNSFRQSHSLTSLANRIVNSPLSMKNPSRRPLSSLNSLKTNCTNSSESVQVEEYDKSSESESESETPTGKSKKVSKKRNYRPKPSRINLRTVPVIPSYQKSLTSSVIHSISYS